MFTYYCVIAHFQALKLKDYDFRREVGVLQKKASQQELGKLSGISGDIIGKYECDEMKPSIETAKKLADALEVSFDYLVGGGELKVLDKKNAAAHPGD